MTATLIVLLIITLMAMIFLPFSRALMKDRAELYENPMEKKFNILITQINALLMNGQGEIVKFKNDPRMLNLFDENLPNMIIHFFYSTGTLTITLYYKYYNDELVKKMQFHNLRQADTFIQMDVANNFCEEASLAIREHRKMFSNKQVLKKSAGENTVDSQSLNKEYDNQVDLGRRMYDNFTTEEKLAWINVAKIIYTADGSSVNDFENHPRYSDLLVDFKVSHNEAQAQFNQIGESGIIKILDNGKESDLIVKLMPVFPFVLDKSGLNEARIRKLYSIFGRLGFTQERIDNDLEKMMLIMQHFGVS